MPSASLKSETECDDNKAVSEDPRATANVSNADKIGDQHGVRMFSIYHMFL